MTEGTRELGEPRGGKPEIHSAKWHRCVDKVKARGGGVNEYAVCTASIGKAGSFARGHGGSASPKRKVHESDPLDLELQAIFRESERGLDPGTHLFEAKSQPLFTRTHQRSQPGKVWSKKKPVEKKQPLVRRSSS